MTRALARWVKVREFKTGDQFFTDEHRRPLNADTALARRLRDHLTRAEVVP